MKLRDILIGLSIKQINADLDMEISDICYDSRAAEACSMFVAIRGFSSDGHKFIPSAVEKGASLVLCEQVPTEDIPYVIVEDSRSALAQCSANFFGNPSKKMKIIGITGTNGKTTTTYLLKHLLETCLGAKVGLVGTNGNMIGEELIHTEHTTPESYELQKLFSQMLDAGCSHVVMEVSSHSLCLNRVDAVHFNLGLFTNLTQDHLDFHDTMEQYADAKAKLFKLCDKAVINLDDAWSSVMLNSCACDYFTISEKDKTASFYARDIDLSAAGVAFNLVHENVFSDVTLKIPGLFSVYNGMGVLAAGVALDIPLADCIEALRTAKGVRGRVEVVETDGDYTILIDYAHTPDALENVLKSMKAVTDNRVVAVFGCGGDRDNKKRPLMGKIAAECADFVIVTSDNPRTENPTTIIEQILVGMEGMDTPYVMIEKRPEAIEWAINNHQKGDVIVLAGKGHEDYQIIGKTKYHMDEREIIAEILDKRKI